MAGSLEDFLQNKTSSSSVRYVFYYLDGLDRRDTINFHISHRVVLSADEILFIEHGSVGLRLGVDGAHRF